MRGPWQFGLASIFAGMLLLSLILAALRQGWIRYLFAGPAGLVFLAILVAFSVTLATVVAGSVLDRSHKQR